MTSQSPRRHDNSMETILTFDNRDLSQWSVVWSTSHIPGMDGRQGSSPTMRVRGRRRLRISSLALSALLTMHCRIPASALTSGFFFFLLFLIASVLSLANPLRHFEVYLGQWSVSGPGRAFRFIPMLDGIGIAMCINAIVRAINCCAIAAMCAVYVIHSVADSKLPFTYCRDFDLRAYDPILKDVRFLALGSRFPFEKPLFEEVAEASTVGLKYRGWRNYTYIKTKQAPMQHPQVELCRETYEGGYPPMFSTPAYNFFFVEVVQLRSGTTLGNFNISLVVIIIFAWLIIWMIMISEKFVYGRLVWNNTATCFIVIPWIWTVILAVTAASNLTLYETILKLFHVGTKDILSAMADALEVALYIHSVTVGSELITGKGLNFFASGHIDPALNGENVWHSATVLTLTGLHGGGAALCALVDNIQMNSTGTGYQFKESTLWVLPMYSKCTSMSGYSHFVSTLVFGGLAVSHLTVTFIMIKTALHTIFEYRVKLVFAEQVVAAILILACTASTLVFATNGGIALLESVDSLMTGVATPFLALMELVGLMYVYRSHDFQSDIRVATEENTCATRIGIQWQIIPFLTAATLVMKTIILVETELPFFYMMLGLAPLVAVIVALPVRAVHNAYRYLIHENRRATQRT